MIRTSYGVRFFDFAYRRSTFAQFSGRRRAGRLTSCREVVSRREVVGRRKEEALERPALPVAGELPGDPRARRRLEIGRRREPRIDLALVARDLVHGSDPLGHLRPREPSGKMIFSVGGATGGRRRRLLPSSPPSATESRARRRGRAPPASRTSASARRAPVAAARAAAAGGRLARAQRDSLLDHVR